MMHKRSKDEPGSQTTGNCGSVEQEQDQGSYPGKFSKQTVHPRATNKTVSEDARLTMLTMSTRVTIFYLSLRSQTMLN